MKTLNENNLRIAEILPEKVSRYTLRAILVTQQETIATDGHMLVSVSLPTETDLGAQGDIPGFIAAPETFDRFLLERDDCLKIKGELPSTGLCLIGAADPGQYRIGLKELDGRHRVIGGPQETGIFPQCERVIPDKDGAQFTIIFSAPLLLKVAEQLAEFASGGDATFRFYTPETPVRVDADSRETLQHMTVVVMPMKPGEKA